jgi:HipA-like protein
MRVLEVYCNGVFAGTLTEENRKSFVFRYDNSYYHDTDKAAVSLTLPKIQQEYHSEYLFPFFFNILSEGVNKQLQCKTLKIDEKDHFGLLMATAQYDTVGAVTVKPLKMKLPAAS